MRIKKANAVLSLFIIALLLIHMGYEFYSYLTFYYNPLVTKIISYGFAISVSVHVVLTIIIVTTRHDGSALRLYPKANIQTILQRASAAGILLLFPVHIKTGDLIAGHLVGEPVLYLLLAAQLLFWCMVMTHIAVSFSRALITLGVLESIKKKLVIDRIVWILCAIAFAASAAIVIRVQMALYYM